MDIQSLNITIKEDVNTRLFHLNNAGAACLIVGQISATALKLSYAVVRMKDTIEISSFQKAYKFTEVL